MKVIVEGLATEYADEGQGTTLLLLHGWMNTLHAFDALASLLAPSYRIVRLDLPGFGGSEAPQEAWHVADYARFVDSFVKKIGIAPTALVGHSFGGRVIIKGVGTGVLSPEKIVLIASAGNARRNTPRLVVYRIVAKIGKAIALFLPAGIYRAFRARLYRAAGSDYLEAGALSKTFVNTVEEDLSRDAAAIGVPALLLWGREDTTTPLSDGERLATTIRGSRLEVFDGGHALMAERALEIAAAIKAFV